MKTVHERATEMSLTFTREFAAPAALVFHAHTVPETFVRWMGPLGTTCDVDHFDARTSGSFRYSVIGGGTYTFFGSYHHVIESELIVHTWEFEGDPGRPTLETLRFVDLGDRRCRLEGSSVYTSTEQCDEMLEFDQSGAGMDENFDRLDGVLSELT